MSNKTYCKTAIINRAVSGSGKTTLSRCVTDALRAQNLTVAVHSTDEFFMQENRYVFELEKLNGYHAQNLANFTADLERGVDVVICDNMNLLPWQAKPYTDAARKAGYKIIFLNFAPRALESHLAAQQVTPEKPDAHGLSEEVLQKFISDWNNYTDLLDKTAPIVPERHKLYEWDEVLQEPVDTGKVESHFDSDAVFQVTPESYLTLKETLGSEILRLMTELTPPRRYLLAWYGITDLRAALGLEETDGPILGALKTGEFTEAVILCYTNPTKEEHFSGDVFSAWKSWRDTPAETRAILTPAQKQKFVDLSCNTKQAHAVFGEWIKKSLQKNGIFAGCFFHSQKLKALNDAEDIYAGATAALALAKSDDRKKVITLHISPGTPVMAFSWGLLALANPGLRIISSSEIGKPHKTVELPFELSRAALRIKPKETDADEPLHFDVFFHLFGIERMPVFFAIKQFPAAHHVFVSSKEYSPKEMGRFLTDGTKFDEVRIDAFLPGSTRDAILAKIQNCGWNRGNLKLGFNLTNGTKVMFADALAACWETHGTPLYMETRTDSFIRLDNKVSIKVNGVSSLEDFFTVRGLRVVDEGKWTPEHEERRALTLALWDNRGVHKIETNNKRVTVGNQKFRIQKELISTNYFSGGWFEEYFYILFEPLLKKGVIRDMRINLKIAKPDNIASVLQEFDVIFTNGTRLFIVECKAGDISKMSENMQKLSDNLKTYGGFTARGYFLTRKSDNEHIAALRRRETEMLKIYFAYEFPKHLSEIEQGIARN